MVSFLVSGNSWERTSFAQARSHKYIFSSICESGVESENQHCSSKPTEHMHEQTPVGTHL